MFSPQPEGADQKKLVIFDIRTGMEKRSFMIDGAPVWPIFRWSKDDKYFARISPNLLSVYETPVKKFFCTFRFTGCIRFVLNFRLFSVFRIIRQEEYSS